MHFSYSSLLYFFSKSCFIFYWSNISYIQLFYRFVTLYYHINSHGKTLLLSPGSNIYALKTIRFCKSCSFCMSIGRKWQNCQETFLLRNRNAFVEKATSLFLKVWDYLPKAHINQIYVACLYGCPGPCTHWSWNASQVF